MESKAKKILTMLMYANAILIPITALGDSYLFKWMINTYFPTVSSPPWYYWVIPCGIETFMFNLGVVFAFMIIDYMKADTD